MLEDLKIMNKETLKETFGINKSGHLDKLYKAIQKVQYPSEGKFCQISAVERTVLFDRVS